MSSIAGILILVVLVVVIAYGLGLYYRQRSGESPGAPGLRGFFPPRRPASPTGGNREVQAVVGWLLSQAFEQTGVKVADDKVAYQRIVEAAEKAVQTLKTQKSVTISLPFLTADASGPKHFETQLTREVIRELARY